MRKISLVHCIGLIGLLSISFLGFWNVSFPFQPRSNKNRPYVKVPKEDLKSSPMLYEEKKISLWVEVGKINQSYVDRFFIVQDKSSLFSFMFLNATEQGVNRGDILVIRGVSFLVSRGYVLVIEWQRWYGTYDLIASIFGALIFLLVLFTSNRRLRDSIMGLIRGV